MDGYYDRSITHLLERPMALCGFTGSGVPEIAARLSALTGLPLIDIERQIQHHLIQPDSTLSQQNTEIRILEDCCTQVPYGFIALRPSTLNNPKSFAIVRRHCQLIYIKKNIFQIFGESQKRLKQPDRTRAIDHGGSNPYQISSFAETFRCWEKSYLKADRILHCDHDSTLQVAREILSGLSSI